MNPMKVVAIINQKGGVGKTTTAVNLSHAISRKGYQVLLVDLDPQANASSSLGLNRDDFQDANIYHVLLGQKSLSEVIIHHSSSGLWVAPSHADLVGVEIELLDHPKREFRLKESLVELKRPIDFVFLDCPPSLGLLTVNGLVAANSFLVPLQCEYFALEGLSQLLHTAALIRKKFNPSLIIEGILLTMFDTRNNLSHFVVKEVKSHFESRVFQTVIPRNVRLSEAPSHGKTIFQYDPKSAGAVHYQALAKEFLRRQPTVKGEKSMVEIVK